MWRWFRGPKGVTPAEGGERPGLQVGAVDQAMRGAGYGPPFATMVDGYMAVAYTPSGPRPDSTWLDPPGHPFGLRVARGHAGARLFALGDGAGAIPGRFSAAPSVERTALLDTAEAGPSRADGFLCYPSQGGLPDEGPLFTAREMEDLWNVYLFDDVLHFVRSWDGTPCYRARLEYRDRFCLIRAVDVLAPRGTDDPSFAIRQVDFLIKALLYGLPSPAPVSRDVPEDPNALALYALSEYGRIGLYPTLEDSTEYRPCLNGVVARMPRPDRDGATLGIVGRIGREEDPEARAGLIASLRGRTLFTAMVIDPSAGPVGPESQARFITTSQGGVTWFHAYTDPAFRVEPPGATVGIAAEGLGRGFPFERFGIVVNPAGPEGCRLSPEDLRALGAVG